MFRFVRCFGLVVFQLVLIRTTLTAFTSEFDNDLETTLETGIPWEFNETIAASQIVIINATVQNNSAFCLVQLHTFLHNISLFYGSGEAVGTDIGVILYPQDDKIEFSIYNPNKLVVKALGFVTSYSNEAPIPGAYLPSNETMKPHLLMNVSKNLVSISAISALEVFVDNGTCTSNSTKYKLYYMYTKEKDFSIGAYFDGIRTMVFPDQMINEALEYKLPLSVDETNHMINVIFAKYPGTGLLFKLVAIGENGSSAYAVAHTFGCDYLSDKDSCIYLVNTFHRVEVVILCVAGLVLCFCGYEWKSFEVSIMTILLVSIFIYTGLYNLLSLEANIITSTAIAFGVSCFTLICVSCFKCIHARHSVSFAVFGLLASSGLLFYVGVGNSAGFKSEEIYWATFFAIALSSFVLLYLNKTLSHYFTTSVIGSFMTVLTIDYFAGSSLKFVILDNIRRVSVGNFTEAYISPPFQTPDVVLSVLWFALAVSSVAYQSITHIMSCDVGTEETESEVAIDRHDNLESTDSVGDRSDNGYSTFDDTLALIDPDPYQRWLFPSRKSL